MYHPDPSTTDTPLDHEALKLLSFYTLVASLVPNSNLPSINGPSPKSTHFSTTTSSPSPSSETPKMKITIDTSTAIIGHGNTIQLPSPGTTNERIQSLLEIACRHLPDRSAADDEEEAEYGDEGFAPPGAMDVEIKLNAGVNICGSKNVVILGGGGGGVRPGQGQGVKRKAEGEVADTPEAKKAATS